MKFLDQAKVYMRSGNGGPGSISFRREANVPMGGPDGGSGGAGGNVIAVAVNGLNTLIDYRYRQHFKAESGHPGAGKDRSGASGKDVVLKLPVGTQIFTDDQKTLIADLTQEGQKIVLARGGSGGKGNAFFKSSTNRAPRKSQPGEQGQEMWIWLRLKLIADVGLLGLPNAGKSTLLKRISKAKPKIADYPFTTLHPNLGVVNIDKTEFVMADIPGLIEGAHAGAGLGHRFLGHIERCGILLHLVDATGNDPVTAWQSLRRELKEYGKRLYQKPELVAITKLDATSEDYAKDLILKLKKSGAGDVVAFSSMSGAGITMMLRQISSAVKKKKAAELRSQEAKPWSP